MKAPQVGHGTSSSVLTAGTRMAFTLWSERSPVRSFGNPDMGKCSPFRAESGGLQSHAYTCPTKFDADVIFDTKFRFQPAANRNL